MNLRMCQIIVMKAKEAPFQQLMISQVADK